MTYPAIVASTAGFSLIILLKFTIPMLTELLSEFSADLPLVTRMIMKVSDLVTSVGPFAVLGLIAAVIGIVLYRRRPAGKLVTDRISLRLPVLGSMIQKSSVARITQTLASLLSSGIPLLEAIELTKNNTDNAVFSQDLERARLQLLSGASLSDSLGQSPNFPSMLIEVGRVGEMAGNMSEQLEVISKVLQDEFDSSMDRLTGMIEPVMILGVGAIVGLIGFTVISTVYKILPAIGES